MQEVVETIGRLMKLFRKEKLRGWEGERRDGLEKWDEWIELEDLGVEPEEEELYVNIDIQVQY